MKNVEFSEDGKTLIRCPKSYKGKFVVPEGVTKIEDEAFYGCAGLTSIEIPDSVTEIGQCAFWGCTGLISIDIPDSVTEIESYAFEDCTGLTSIDIPDSVTEIGDSVFNGCNAISSPVFNKKFFVRLPKDYEGKYIIPQGISIIASGAFVGCAGLTAIDIPESVTEIEGRAFDGCAGLTAIDIPKSVTKIGGSAFGDCAGLTAIEIPDSITKIEESTFWGCKGLTSIDIPDSVIELDSDGSEFDAIASPVFNKKFFVRLPKYYEGKYVIPQGISVIIGGAFSDCAGLTSIEIPDSVTKIEPYAFSGCTGLTEVKIPDGVTIINMGVFFDCTGLTAIEIPIGVTEIVSGAFENCYGLTSIEIPESVTKIGSSVFKDCIGLTTIEIPDSVTEIEDGAFDECRNLRTIRIPDSVKSIGDYAFTNIGPKLEITVGDDNESFCSIDGSLYSKDKTTLYHCCENGVEEFTVPESVREIGKCAFEWSRLKKITLQEGVEYIDYEAFLESFCPVVCLPGTIKWIGRTAFKKCDMKELHIRSKNPREIDVDESAFEECAENCVLYVPVGTGYAYRHHPVFGKFKEVVIER